MIVVMVVIVVMAVIVVDAYLRIGAAERGLWLAVIIGMEAH